jgi:hypothetical protein
VDCIDLAQDRDKWNALLNVLMNFVIPQSAGKLSSGYTTGALSSNVQLRRVSYLLKCDCYRNY